MEDLSTDLGNFQNYSGADEDEEAVQALESYYEKGNLARFDTLRQLQDHLGDEPVLSKLARLKKQKFNPDTGQYAQKNRIILDCGWNGVSPTSVRKHKSVLPRTTDAVSSALESLDMARDEQQLLAKFIHS